MTRSCVIFVIEIMDITVSLCALLIFCILPSTFVPALPLYFDFTFPLSSFPLSLLDYSLTPLVGSMSDFTAPNTSRVVTDLSCPVFSRYDRCNATITEGNCDDRDGPLLLTCIQSKYIAQINFVFTIKIYFVIYKYFWLFHCQDFMMYCILAIFSLCTAAPSCDHGSVRIVGGPNNYTGRPEFCYFGTWRTICGIGFDRYDAAVTCSLAGFNHDCKYGG